MMIGRCSHVECGVEGNLALIVLVPLQVLACDKHYKSLYETYIKKMKSKNVNLGQSSDRWTGSDGRVRNISVGKEWEINNRVLSKDDGKTMINRVTGKPAQY